LKKLTPNTGDRASHFYEWRHDGDVIHLAKAKGGAGEGDSARQDAVAEIDATGVPGERP